MWHDTNIFIFVIYTLYCETPPRRASFWLKRSWRGSSGLAAAVDVTLSPPRILCIENHEWNIQRGVRMNLTPRAKHAAEAADRLALVPHRAPQPPRLAMRP